MEPGRPGLGLNKVSIRLARPAHRLLPPPSPCLMSKKGAHALAHVGCVLRLPDGSGSRAKRREAPLRARSPPGRPWAAEQLKSSTVQGYGKVKANPPCDGFTPAIATGCRRLVETMGHPRVHAVLAGPQPRPPPLPGLSPRAGLVPESRGLAQGRVFRGPHGCAPPHSPVGPRHSGPCSCLGLPTGTCDPRSELLLL